MAELHIDSDSEHMTLEMFSTEKLRASSNALVADLMRAFDAVRECGEKMKGV